MTEPLDDQVRELLAIGELVDVRFLSFRADLRGELREDIKPDELESSMQVQVGRQPGVLEIRIDFDAITTAADYSVVAATQFHFDEEQPEVSEELGRAFAEKVGVMAVYPYVREALQSMSMRLRQDAITLPLLRAGGVSLTNPQPYGEAGPSASANAIGPDSSELEN